MKIENDLYTSRMLIRNCQRADLPELTAMWFDEENGRYLSDPAEEYVDDRFRRALDEIENNPKGFFLTLVLRGSRKIIGSCFIFPDEDKKGSFELAYCIHKDYWRQGYASEMLPLLLAWVRRHGGSEVTAEAAKENAASDALLRKFGFEVVGESSFKKYNMDVFFDSYLYRLVLVNSPVECTNQKM